MEELLKVFEVYARSMMDLMAKKDPKSLETVMPIPVIKVMPISTLLSTQWLRMQMLQYALKYYKLLENKLSVLKALNTIVKAVVAVVVMAASRENIYWETLMKNLPLMFREPRKPFKSTWSS